MPTVGELSWPAPGVALGEATERVLIATFPAEPRAQAKERWCWAAVCEAVAASRSRPIDQAAIVRKCMPDAADDNQTYFPHMALRKLGASFVILDTTRLREQITACCTRDEVVITVLLKSGGSDTHAVCAFGIAKVRGQPALVLYDPLPPDKGAAARDLIKVVPLATMAAGYLEGTDQGARGYWRSAIQVTGFGDVA